MSKLNLKTKPKQKTLALIKPEAFRNRQVGAIISAIEKSGLEIVKLRLAKLPVSTASAFYAVHKDRPFYASLLSFMTSGPVVMLVLQGEDAVERYRKLIGNTDPSLAKRGTIRAKFGTDKEKNAVHGSDSVKNARAEINLLFGK